MKKARSRVFCFDIDNVICTTKGRNYSKAIPKKKIIKVINKLYENGHYIKIYTARYMGRNKDNIKKAYSFGYKKTLSQLKKWDLKFHRLIMGKPSFDLCVDDRALGFKKNWYKDLNKILKK